MADEKDRLREEVRYLKDAYEKEQEKSEALKQEIELLNTQWKSEKERADREEDRANKLEAELLSELEKAKEHSEMLAKSLPALSRLLEGNGKSATAVSSTKSAGPTEKEEKARKEKEELEKKKAAEDQKKKEEVQKQKEEADQKKKREAEQKAKEEQELKKKKEAELKEREAERKRKEEAEERQRKEEEEKKRKEGEAQSNTGSTNEGEAEKGSTAPAASAESTGTDVEDDYAKQVLKNVTASAIQVAQDEAREWIEKLTGETIPSNAFAETIKSGVILCKMLNVIKPNTVPKINTANLKMPFMQMENISRFLKGCETLGVPSYDLFQTNDLFQGKNIRGVVACIHSLGRTLKTKPVSGFNGPHFVTHCGKF